MARETKTAVPAVGREFLWHLDLIETRLLSLAEAFTPEQYHYRPAPDARAIREVLLHVAGGNRLGAASVGGPPLAQAELARIEAAPLDKPAVIATLRESLALLRRLAEATVNFDAETTLFGRAMTCREVLFIAAGHMHQHLGQLIAYARMNGVLPAWSNPA